LNENPPKSVPGTEMEVGGRESRREGSSNVVQRERSTEIVGLSRKNLGRGGSGRSEGKNENGEVNGEKRLPTNEWD